MPATRIVESDDLLAANSLLGVTASIGQVAGPLAWLRAATAGAATAGAVAVAREPGLRAIALVRMGMIFTSGTFLVIEPLYTRHVLHQPSAQFALFEAAGFGAVVTGLLLSVIRRVFYAEAVAAGAVCLRG